MSGIKLIVGLGNPGSEYASTRHNIGAIWMMRLAHRNQITLKADKKCHGLIGQGVVEGQSVRLLFPMTFMNRSGQAVKGTLDYFKIKPEELLVAHDELDLPNGAVRLKQNGGHGGHNGLRDIHQHLGHGNYWRVRLGIGHPGHKSMVSSFVLKPPSKAEATELELALDRLDRQLSLIMTGQYSQAMQALHGNEKA